MRRGDVRVGSQKAKSQKLRKCARRTNRFGGLVAMFGPAARCTGRARHSGRQAGTCAGLSWEVGCAVAASPEPARDLPQPRDPDAQHRCGRRTRRAVDVRARCECGGDKYVLDAVQLVQFTLQRGAQCATGSGSLAIRSTSPHEVRESWAEWSAQLPWRSLG
jgi:hypothetical protein